MPNQSNSSAIGRWQDVEAVWVLAGSAGAGQAVQEFLNAIPDPQPFQAGNHATAAQDPDQKNY